MFQNENSINNVFLKVLSCKIWQVTFSMVKLYAKFFNIENEHGKYDCKNATFIHTFSTFMNP